VAASLVGIKVKRMVCLSYALSAAIGGLGGAMVAPITFMTYDAGTMLGLKGFVAGVLGGLGNTWGALAGGLFLGVLESFSAGYVSSLFKETVALIVLILVLLTKPSGLFGRAQR
jgi:branched-chain amino acid transport system permease protein